eukprot:4219312-Lingulodinium_polyedra.AAC.1
MAGGGAFGNMASHAADGPGVSLKGFVKLPGEFCEQVEELGIRRPAARSSLRGATCGRVCGLDYRDGRRVLHVP